MKMPAIFFGLLLTVILGGGCLIRYFRDGDVYIAELVGGVIGLFLLMISLFVGKRQGQASR
jgi:hypothetical protein